MTEPPLRSMIHHDAVIGLVERTDTTTNMVVGAWGGDGTFLDDVLIRRDRVEPCRPRFTPPLRHERPAYLYGGVLCRDFGHFLTETLARYWAIRQSNRRLMWVPQAGLTALSAWQRDILKLLGLGPAPGLIHEPTRFADLEIPTAGLALNLFCHRAHAEALGVVPFGAPRPGTRVWLSRSRLADTKSQVLNEQELEALLQQDGWTVVHPQHLGIADQLAHLAAAETVAGFDGSAFHALLLGRDVRAHVILIPRGIGTTVNKTFHLIAEAKAMR